MSKIQFADVHNADFYPLGRSGQSQDFGGGGPPGRRHLAMHQWYTRLKLSRAAGDL